MAMYTHELAIFPNAIDPVQTYADLNDSDIPLLNQYNRYVAAGDLNAMKVFLEANPNFSNKIMTTEKLNYIMETMRNMEIFAKSRKQSIYIQDTEPTDMIHDDVWLD